MDQIVVDKKINNMETDKIDLWKAINSLEDELRIVVVLYYFEDHTIKEIAEILRKPEGTVKSRLHTSRARLAKIIDDGKRGVWNE